MRRMGVVTEKVKSLRIWVMVKVHLGPQLHKAGASWRLGLHRARRDGEKSLDLISLAIEAIECFMSREVTRTEQCFEKD